MVTHGPMQPKQTEGEIVHPQVASCTAPGIVPLSQGLMVSFSMGCGLAGQPGL